MRSPAEHLAFDFVRECVLLGRKWRARVDEGLRDNGLTLARATVIYWISKLPEGSSQRELADVVGIEGPTLVRILHALEEQKLVERIPLPSDRRAKGLRLTPAAQPLLDRLDETVDQLLAQYLSRLDGRRLRSATNLAREARQALS